MLSNKQLEDFEDRAIFEINRDFSRRYGRIVKMACKKLNIAFATQSTWKEIWKYLEERATKSRSDAIALEMYEEFIHRLRDFTVAK